MAHTVFFHVGLPKTGTTYLQSVLWDNRAALAARGVLLPGESSRQHLWASGVVRDDPRIGRRGPAAPLAWDRLVAEVNAWDGVAVISHEFFAPTSAEQARRAVAALAEAEVHVVVTARDTLSLVTARWQEFVKNGETVPIDDYPLTEQTDPVEDWDWGSLDLADVVRRWGSAVPHDRVHVLTLPRPDEPRETLWLRFAGLLGLDPAGLAPPHAGGNESLGVVEVELLRRVNADLVDFGSAQDRGNWIRGYLAQGKLVPRAGDKFWPSPARVKELCERGRRIAEEVAAGGYHVVGDVADLRPPDVVPERRHPDDVTDAELLAAATAVIAEMMTDVRRLTREARRPPSPPAPEQVVASSSVRRVAAAVSRRLRRRTPGT
ncbi:MAG: hypothetical protein WB798_11050 [Nocardioidaceae bacterium]